MIITHIPWYVHRPKQRHRSQGALGGGRSVADRLLPCRAPEGRSLRQLSSHPRTTLRQPRNDYESATTGVLRIRGLT